MLQLNPKLIVRSLAFVGLMSLGSMAFSQDQNQGQPEATFTIGSNELDIVKFVQTVAAATGKTIILDPAVKGKVKIMTNNNAMTKDELFELFRAVLELSNFSVVEVGDIVKIIPIKEVRTSPIGELSKTTGSAEVVTDVIPAQNISSAKLLAALRPLVSSNYNINHHDGSNSIIITDTRANIERIRRVIKKIDTAAVPTTEVVQLKYAEAEPLVQTLNQLDGQDKAAAGLSNKLQMVADKRNNAILLAGEDLQRQRIKSLIKSLDRPAAQTGSVRVIYLEYADAVRVAETLTKVVQNISRLGPGGEAAGANANAATVEADEDTNALLITAEGDTLNSLLSVVERLDIRRAQVLVEAIIVELNIQDQEELGTEWLFSNENEGLFGAGPSGGSEVPRLAGAIADESLTSLATGLSGITGNALGIAGIGGRENFLALIKALDSSSKANILSTPILLTMDNKEAEISVGQEVPFQTGSFSSPGNAGGNIGSPFTTFQRESIGIMLKITPQINEGDKVLLDIEQEVSGIDETATSSQGIITKQSKINTQVLAQDGEIIVLGGLIEEEADQGASRVPVLGSIPILGYLFKYQRTRIQKTNLMVFLRAEIVRDDDVMNAATAEKYQRIRGSQLELRESGLPLMNDKHLPVLPETTFKELFEGEKGVQDLPDAANDAADDLSELNETRKEASGE